MRKAILLVLFLILSAKPAMASENWKSYPENTCQPYPVISACNLNYIFETNIQSLSELVFKTDNKMTSGISLLYQVPPVSSREFVTYMGSRFHIPGSPQPAYAASGGIGFNSLSPVLKIWTTMRNLAYFAFAVIFVVIGVMILIRSKIDPKTAVTIQNALPRIILALILVTFSYAIAGFMIDIMYVALALVLTIAGSINIPINGTVVGNNTVQLGNNILAHNLFWAWFDPNMNLWGTIGNAGQTVGPLLSAFVSGAGDQGILDPIWSILKSIAGGVVALIIAIAILWALFRTWLSLISAYANILLGIMFSPLQLMIDAIPGQNQFSGWLRTMLANLMAFPAVLAMILIGVILTNSNEGNWGGTAGFSPPLIGATNQQAMQALIGVAIILTIPKTVDILQEIIKAPKQKWGSAWNETLNQARAGLTTAGTTGYQKWGESKFSGYRTYRQEGIRKGIGESFTTQGRTKGAAVGGEVSPRT